MIKRGTEEVEEQVVEDDKDGMSTSIEYARVPQPKSTSSKEVMGERLVIEG